MIQHIPETVAVVLTESQREMIAQLVASGRVASADEYMRDLLAADERANDLALIEGKLLQAIDANNWTEISPSFAEELFERAARRVACERQ